MVDMNFAQAIAEMQGAFDEIQQPRSDYVLQNFVVGEKDTDPARYAQCVLELQIKYDVIRQAKLHRRKLEIEIAEFEALGTETSQIDAALKRIDIEIQDRAYLGASREFEALYGIWKSFPHKYTHEELNAAQREYWEKRLTRQANQDLIASGRVSVGNIDALRQIGQLPKRELLNE
jgi:hypothetical protein